MRTRNAVEVRNVSYTVDGQSLFNGLSFIAAEGELTAITGPSGSGKTTLLCLVGGLLRTSAGSINASHGRSTAGFIFQRFGLIGYLTALENVTLALRPSKGRAVSELALDALGAVGLNEVAGRLAQDLSGGQQQRVAVARAIAGQRTLILADEPTSELDAENRARIMNLLRRRAEAGAVVIVSSDDPEVTSACGQIIDLGR